MKRTIGVSLFGVGCAMSVIFAGMVAGEALAAEPAGSLEQDKKCTVCHNESWPSPVLSIYQTKMGVRGDPRTPSCQNCHGPSENHLKSPVNQVDVYFGTIKPGPLLSDTWPKTPSSAEARNGACLACHSGEARTRWDGGPHQVNEVACTNCHNIHAPVQKVLNRKTQTEVCFACHKEQRADSLKISTHPIKEGKVVCSDCHNPHGSPGPSMVKKNTINETCYVCHAERRGPFLFEHQPVVENCANCHLPHGSNLSPMLVSRAPWLCQSCHDGQHSSENPIGRNAASNQGGFTGASPSNQATGRGCLNCHSVIHGSNSPNGGYFQR